MVLLIIFDYVYSYENYVVDKVILFVRFFFFVCFVGVFVVIFCYIGYSIFY